jgi:hypothetical protein
MVQKDASRNSTQSVIKITLYNLAKLQLPNHRNELIIVRVFLILFFVLILYGADPPEPARARRRADMQAAAQLANTRAGRRCRRLRCLSGSLDEAGHFFSRVARSASRPTASPRLAKRNINLTWLTSALRTWTISRRTRTNKETRSRCLRQSSGSSARSDVGNPLGYEGGLCKISSSVAVSTAVSTARCVWPCSKSKE